MNLFRSIAAVILGYAVFAVSAVLLFQIAKRDPHAPQSLSFELFAVVYGMLFAALGGMLAAWIAPAKRMLHASFAALLIGLGAAVSLLTAPGAVWTQLSALLLMAPSAWLGAWVLARRSGR